MYLVFLTMSRHTAEHLCLRIETIPASRASEQACWFLRIATPFPTSFKSLPCCVDHMWSFHGKEISRDHGWTVTIVGGMLNTRLSKVMPLSPVNITLRSFPCDSAGDPNPRSELSDLNGHGWRVPNGLVSPFQLPSRVHEFWNTPRCTSSLYSY